VKPFDNRADGVAQVHEPRYQRTLFERKRWTSTWRAACKHGNATLPQGESTKPDRLCQTHRERAAKRSLAVSIGEQSTTALASSGLLTVLRVSNDFDSSNLRAVENQSPDDAIRSPSSAGRGRLIRRELRFAPATLLLSGANWQVSPISDSTPINSARSSRRSAEQSCRREPEFFSAD